MIPKTSDIPDYQCSNEGGPHFKYVGLGLGLELDYRVRLNCQDQGNGFKIFLLGHGIIHCYFHEVQYCTYIVKITFKINIIIVNNISQFCIHVFLEKHLCMIIMSK